MKKIIKAGLLLLSFSSASAFAIDVENVSFFGDGCDENTANWVWDDYEQNLSFDFLALNARSDDRATVDRRKCFIRTKLQPKPGHRIVLTKFKAGGQREIFSNGGSAKLAVAHEFNYQILPAFTEAKYGYRPYESWTAESLQHQAEGRCDQPVTLRTTLNVEATDGLMELDRGGIHYKCEEVRCY